MTVLVVPLVPVAAAAGLLALRERPRVLGPLAVAGVLAALAVAGWAAVAAPGIAWGWGPVLEGRLAVEGFARVMVVLVPAVAAPIVGYAAATEDDGRVRLLALMVAFVGVMQLLVVAADLLTLLIAWELVGAASWALIGHHWRDPATGRAAAQAFVTTRIGDLGLYVAAGAALAATGTLTFAGLAGAGRPALDLVAVGVVLAAAAKSAQLPFAPWLFAAMAGPTPVSALLHSATLVAAGAYLLVRLAPVLAPVGWFPPAVAAIGLATALAGGVVASVQPHAKRVLAASTSAQYGLMFVAVGAGSAAAAGAHLVTHAAFKSLLFLGAGAAIHAAGTGQLARMRLGSALPHTAALSAVGVLALAAVPPLGAAWTKEQIVAAAAHASAWLAGGVLAAAFLSAFYAARYQLLAFGPFGAHATAANEPGHRPGKGDLVPAAVLAGATVLASALWLPGSTRVVERATAGTLAGIAWWELAAALAAIGVAFALAAVLWRRGRLAALGLPARTEVVGDWLGLPAAARVAVVGPVLGLSRLLARGDDRVIDGGVRATARLAAALSGLLSRRGEWTIDGAVRAVAAATLRAAVGSRSADEHGVDAAVEGVARGVGAAGHRSRRLQTGLAHQYFLIVVTGLAAAVVVLALVR